MSLSIERPAVCALIVATMLGGCATRNDDDSPIEVSPATAAVSPPLTAPPSGMLIAVPGAVDALAFDTTSGAAVALLDTGSGPSVAVVRGRDVRTVTLPSAPAPAPALAPDGRGHLLAPVRGGYLRIDPAAATVESVDVAGEADTDVTAVAVRADGRVVLGTAAGDVLTLGPGATDGRDEPGAREVAARVGGFVRVDGLVARGDTAVVLDRAETSVTAIDPDGAAAAQSLRAGTGATTLAVDADGRVLVADSRGGELLVYGAEPLILRQRRPVPGVPYGLAGSPALAWVSETATNTVVGYDLATGTPVEKVRHRTVRQPDSMAFDAATGSLYVGSAVGDGVQVIPDAAVPR